VLQLAKHHPFARKLVNSGRLSVPSFLVNSTLNTPDVDRFEGRMVPGAPVDDAPSLYAGQPDWLLHHLGQRFVCLVFCDTADSAAFVLGQRTADALEAATPGVSTVWVFPPGTPPEPTLQVSAKVLWDRQGLIAQRFDAQPGTCYLIRPDQHVAARWRSFQTSQVAAALARATARNAHI
jgi:3-(3-hydroxy-phenyl)propionate hydroxylase